MSRILGAVQVSSLTLSIMNYANFLIQFGFFSKFSSISRKKFCDLFIFKLQLLKIHDELCLWLSHHQKKL